MSLARPCAAARRTVRRLLRSAGIVAAAIVAWVTVRVLLGPWAAAGLAALVLGVALIAAWAAVEARLFARPGPPGARPARPGPGLRTDDHVAFARALSAVAAAYLAECEREADR